MHRMALRPGPGLVRLLLAMIVVLSHLSAWNLGRPAVMLFFMISGFWVTRSWQGWSGGALAFMANRALRLYPLFLGVALVQALLLALLGRPLPVDPAQALLLPGIASRGESLLGVDWSLDIELQFYLALPLLAPALLQARRLDLWLLAGAGWLAGLSLMAAGLVTALFYLPAFAAGAWLAASGWRARGRQALGALALFAVAGVALALLPATRALVIKTGIAAPGMAVQLGQMAWALLLLPALAWSLGRASDARDRWCGDVSFSLYLVHVPVIIALTALWPAPGLLAKLALLGAAMLVAAALQHWIDLPAEQWRRAHLGKPAPHRGNSIPGAVAAAPLNSPAKRPN